MLEVLKQMLYSKLMVVVKLRLLLTRFILRIELYVCSFGIAQRLTEEYTVDFKMVNGIPGVIVTINNKVTYVLSFAFEDEKISNIYMMVNPEKLMHLNKNIKSAFLQKCVFIIFLTFQEVHLFASYLKFNFPVFFINTCNNRYSNH